jgi:hypothetical protein
MKPGDHVVCIDASISPEKSIEIVKDFEEWVKQDEEYIIREILDNEGIVEGVLLEEVHNIPKFFKILNRFQEPAFASWRFRKLNYAVSFNEEEELENLLEELEITAPLTKEKEKAWLESQH